mmetsp:Transcript_74125/g.143425  ORF Transcript_74125/g.143425 Transcript_74125/m.143425 type:complete len:666 (+) Transcript_74125:53-2050(+)
MLCYPPWRHASSSTCSSSSRGNAHNHSMRKHEQSRTESREEDGSLLCKGPSKTDMQGTTRRVGFAGVVFWCALLAVTCVWLRWQALDVASPRDVLGLASENAQTPPIVWTWAAPMMSCDLACKADTRLHTNGLVGCCREDASWPQSEKALVTSVLQPLRVSCSVKKGENNFDPSTSPTGQCFWNADNMGNRCQKNPGHSARRLCACSLPWGPENTPAELAFISLAGFDEHAVCNDGSPAGYYFKQAVKNSGQEDVWVVMLNGGGQCYNIETCRGRAFSARSSRSYPPRRKFFGIYAKASPVHEANLVYLPYCSSDGFVGNIAAKDNPIGFHFRGDVIVRAVMRHLVEAHGLTAKQLVIFGGMSSGARGAMIHLDRLVAPRGPLPYGTRVLGYLDSPLWIDQATLPKPRYVFKRHPRINLTNQTVIMLELSNASGAVLMPECLRALKHPWQCWFGMYRLPLLRTPYVLVASQYDQFQLATNLQFEFLHNHLWPLPRVEYEAWADEFAAATRLQLAHIASPNFLQSRSSADADKERKGDETKKVGDAVTANGFRSGGSPLTRPRRGGFSPLAWLSHMMQHDETHDETNPSPAPGPRAILSWSCYNHAKSLRNEFFTISAGGLSQADVLLVAIMNVTGTHPGLSPMPVIVEDCGGISCGQGCQRLYRC